MLIKYRVQCTKFQKLILKKYILNFNKINNKQRHKQARESGDESNPVILFLCFEIKLFLIIIFKNIAYELFCYILLEKRLDLNYRHLKV